MTKVWTRSNWRVVRNGALRNIVRLIAESAEGLYLSL